MHWIMTLGSVRAEWEGYSRCREGIQRPDSKCQPQHPFLPCGQLQTNTHPNGQYQGCKIRDDVEDCLSVKVCFFIHTTSLDIKVPRAGDGRTAEDGYTDRNQDVYNLEGPDRVG
jgi:hypothetical protein